MVTFKENNKALADSKSHARSPIANLNEKLFDMMIERGVLESYLLFPLSKITQPEHTSQFKLVGNPQSNRINDLSINKTVAVALCDNFTPF